LIVNRQEMTMGAIERPISAVLYDIVGQVEEIVRSEIHLAKTEVREELKKARPATVLMALALASAFLTLFFALLSLVYALSLVIPAWAAALCVTGVVASIAVLSGRAALQRYKTTPMGAPKTVASVKENFEWAKQQTR
jgi:uncharacterized membrane protein YqjE